MDQKMPVLDRTIRDLLDELAANPGPPIYELTPEEARSSLLRAQSGSVRKPDAQGLDGGVGSGSSSAPHHSPLYC